MLSRDDATALVLASPLFDEAFYAEVTGREFASREEAVAHWVAQPGDDAPHPLFEPVWLYPNGWWRKNGPDPLSYYLSRERPPRTPHPRFPRAGLGLTLEEWLVDHDPAELLPEPETRAPVREVVVELRSPDPNELVRWVRHLDDLPVTVDVSGLDAARRRLLAAVAIDLPGVRTEALDDAEQAGVTTLVTIDEGVTPPPWDWLDQLLAALDASEADAVQPALVGDDRTLTAPARAGHPVSSLDLLDGAELATRFPGVEARRVRDGRETEGPARLTTAIWLPGARYKVTALDARVPAPHDLVWAIDIAAGASPAGRRWGDWHFVHSLAAALTRLGQTVEIDHPETRGRESRRDAHVVLTLRGLERVPLQDDVLNLLWVISHPEDVTADEIAGYDAAWAAGAAWAGRHGVPTLLQCTDTTRFHPGVGEPADDGRALFVGNARGGPRPVVTTALAAGVEVDVVGAAWADHGVTPRAEAMANAELPAAYATAGVVLNDHHDDMRREGFVSNRVFDVLAVGGRLLTDEVAGLAEAVGADVPVWRTGDDLARLARPPYDAWPGREERRALAERVVAEHSFDARAATLLAEARRLLDSGL